MIAWIGPCISGERYEVSPDLAASFASAFPDAVADRTPFLDGRFLDLVALNAHQLRRAGLSADNIETSGLCTFTLADAFPSYRREGEKAGRILSAIGIRP